MKCVPDTSLVETMCQLTNALLGTCSFLCVKDAAGDCKPLQTVADLFVQQACIWQSTAHDQCTFPCRMDDETSSSWLHGDPSPPSWWSSSPPAAAAAPPPPPGTCGEYGAPDFLKDAYVATCRHYDHCEACVHHTTYCAWGDVTQENKCPDHPPAPPPHAPPPSPPPLTPPPPGCHAKDDLWEDMRDYYEGLCNIYSACPLCTLRDGCAWHGSTTCVT